MPRDCLPIAANFADIYQSFEAVKAPMRQRTLSHLCWKPMF